MPAAASRYDPVQTEQVRRALTRASEPLQERFVTEAFLGTDPARAHQDIDRAAKVGVMRRVGQGEDATGRDTTAHVVRVEFDLIAATASKDFERSGEIEDLDRGNRKEHDAPHATSMAESVG